MVNARRLAGIALVVGVALTLGAPSATHADPPPDSLAPPNFLSEAELDPELPFAGKTVSLTVPPVIGAQPITTSCTWQDGGNGTVGAGWTDIAGATSCSAFTIPSNLTGHWLRGHVMAHNSTSVDGATSTPELRVGGDRVYAPGGGGIWAENFDGSNPRQIASGFVAYQPSVSWDGTKIAFLRDSSSFGTDVWVMNADGSNLVSVATHAGGPTLSPNGDRVAWSDTYGVWVANSDGSGTPTHVPVPIGDGYGPPGTTAWSPDGQWIAVTTSPSHRWHIWKHYSITNFDLYFTSSNHSDCSGGAAVDTECKLERSIYLLRPDGTDGGFLTQAPDVTDAASYANVNNYFYETPAWSWDGLKLVGQSCASGFQQAGCDRQYRTYDTQTGAITVYPNLTGTQSPPHFAVDGTIFYDGSVPTFLPPTAVKLPDGQTYGDELADNPTGEVDEVNTGTGAYAYHSVDLSLPGIDIPFELKRSYNSHDLSTGGPLGTGWQWSFGAKLTAQTGGNWLARAADGQQLLFVKQANGSFVPSSGGTSKLVLVGANYELTTDLMKTYVFDSTGRLLNIRGPNGKTLTMTYTGSLLTKVTDSVGRAITLGYLNNKLASATLADARKVSYTYDSSGRLQTFVDLRGKTWTYGYDGTSNRLASIKDPLGHFVSRVTYDPNENDPAKKRVISKLDPRDVPGVNPTTYDWNATTETATITDRAHKAWNDDYANGTLVKRTDPLGHATTYRYDRNFRMVKQVDARNNPTTFTYDDNGNMLTRQAPPSLGYVESWSYNTKNQVVAYTDGRGLTTRNFYDGAGNLTKRIGPAPPGETNVTTWDIQAGTGLPTFMLDSKGGKTQYFYDAQGNRTSVVTPALNKTVWTYDGYGRVLTKIDPRGNVTGCNCARTYTTTYTYDAAGNVLTEKDELARITTYTYDNAGNVATKKDPKLRLWQYFYDNANNQIKVIAPNGAQTLTDYDERGKVSASTTPAGITTYRYDDAGRKSEMVTPRGNVAGCNCAANFRWTYDYDATNNLTAVNDPYANATTYTYDALNRRKTMADARSKTWSYDYDADGNLTQTTDPLNHSSSTTYDELNRRSTATDARGKTTLFFYDRNNNLVLDQTQLGFQTVYNYDADNRLISKVTPRGNVAACNCAATYKWAYTYDADGNLLTVTDPAAKVTKYTYDAVGNRLTQTDALSHVTKWAYDVLDRLTSTTDPIGKATAYAYADIANAGSSVTRTDALTRPTKSVYDLAGRLTELHKPGQVKGTERLWRYEYDEENQLKKKTDALGGITQYGYDRRGLQTSIDYSDSTPDVAYSYDEVGHRASMADGQGPDETYTYDNAERLKTVTRGPNEFSYDYDENGQVTLRALNGTNGVTYHYDDDNRMDSVATATSATTYAYDAEAHLVSTTLPASNGYVESRAYDPLGRLTEVKSAKGASVLNKATVTYDVVGNPTRIDHIGTASETYKYDADDRILEACFKASGAACSATTDPYVRWTYDAVGNRITEKRGAATGATSTTLTYNYADQLTKNGTTTYLYDANGQQTSAGLRSYVWNVAGRVTSSSVGSNTVTYTYDGDGKRLSASTGPAPAQTTKYLWDTNFALPELAVERDGADQPLRRYVNGLETVSEITPAGEFFFHHDAMGSVVNVTDQSGVTQWTRLYEPFGVKRSETKDSPTAPAVPLGYAGEYNEPASGLYDLRARQYDPAVGRFLSEDPMSEPATAPYGSAYAYAGDQPSVFTDPSGLCRIVCVDVPSPGDVAGAIGDAATSGYHAVGSAIHAGGRAVSGGVDLAERAIDKGKDVATSVASTAWRHRDVARTIVIAAVSPASIIIPAVVRMAKETQAVYRESGGGLGGALDAFNVVWNPGYKILASGDSCLTGYGTSNGWGRGTSCASAAVQIGLFVVGGAAGTAVELGASRGLGEVGEGIALRLKFKPGWSPEQVAEANAKAAYLNARAEAGALRKSVPLRSGSSARARFKDAGNDIPENADVDHLQDLQLGGADELANMGPLDSSVNRSLGAQIACQLKNVPVGTRITSVSIC